MAANSKIEWTHHTLNPWSGCSKVSRGCEFCYAETQYSTKIRGVKWGPNGNRIVKAESGWKEPLAWDRAAAKAGERHRVFCASLADVFEDWKGPMLDANGDELWCEDIGPIEEWKDAEVMMPGGGFIKSPMSAQKITKRRLTIEDVRCRLFETINATPNLDWLLLTKRPENFRRMLPDRWLDIKHAPNVWLGVSVEDQQRADERIPLLLQVPAVVRFLSCEPLLGPIDLSKWLYDRRAAIQKAMNSPMAPNRDQAESMVPECGIGWGIVGGESGPKARPLNPSWIKDIVHQCKAASVPCFVKQLGDNVIDFAGAIKAGKGGDPSEWSPDLRVREFPKAVPS